MYENPRLSS